MLARVVDKDEGTNARVRDRSEVKVQMGTGQLFFEPEMSLSCKKIHHHQATRSRNNISIPTYWEN
jgi:hypothetical protein